MSDALNLALTITASSAAGSVLHRLRDRIRGTGEAADKARRDFDKMLNHFQKGVKGLAIGKYLVNKIKPGVDAAADLQTSMLDIKRLMWESGKGASVLNKEMANMRANAVDVASRLPYSATEVANVQRNLLQGGLKQKSILGKHGAAFATSALSAIYHLDPADVAESIAKIGHGFQLKGPQYNQLANDLAQVAGKSPTNMTELLHNLKQSATGAHQMNIDPRTAALIAANSSVIGQEAGSSMNRLFIGMAGASKRGQKAMKKAGLNFFDKEGNPLSFDKDLKQLRDKFGNMSKQKRMVELTRIFRVQGAKVANLLIQTGNKSYDQIKEDSKRAADLTQQEKIWAQGLDANISMLQGTNTSMLANLFKPALDPLTKLVAGTNHLESNISTMATKHKGIAKAVTYGSGALAGAAGAYGLYHILKGGTKGLSFMRRLRGLKNTGLGIAEGKAVQAATGVNPVFVTNWPNGFGVGGMGNDIKNISNRVGRTRGVKGVAGKVGLVGLAGASGYAFGTALNKVLEQAAKSKDDATATQAQAVKETIGHMTASVMSFIPGTAAYKLDHNKPEPTKVDLHVAVESKDGSKVRVNSKQDQHKNVNTTTSSMGG